MRTCNHGSQSYTPGCPHDPQRTPSAWNLTPVCDINMPHNFSTVPPTCPPNCPGAEVQERTVVRPGELVQGRKAPDTRMMSADARAAYLRVEAGIEKARPEFVGVTRHVHAEGIAVLEVLVGGKPVAVPLWGADLRRIAVEAINAMEPSDG